MACRFLQNFIQTSSQMLAVGSEDGPFIQIQSPSDPDTFKREESLIEGLLSGINYILLVSKNKKIIFLAHYRKRKSGRHPN